MQQMKKRNVLNKNMLVYKTSAEQKIKGMFQGEVMHDNKKSLQKRNIPTLCKI